MKSTRLLGLALGASIAMSTAAFAQDISVAVAGPMTGSESAFGRQMKNGADLAVADINAAGAAAEAGAAGRRRACDRSRPARWRKPRQLEGPVRRRALLLVVVDPGLRGLCEATCRESRRHQPIRFTERKLGTCCACAAATTSGLVAAQYIQKNFAGKNVAILNDKTTYGRVARNQKALNAAGTGKAVQSYNKGDRTSIRSSRRSARTSIWSMSAAIIRKPA